MPYEIVARRPGDVAQCYAEPTLAAAGTGWRPSVASTRCADAWRWQSSNPQGIRIEHRPCQRRPQRARRALLACSYDPLTGWMRTGCCEADPNDIGRHHVCAGDGRVSGLQQDARQRSDHAAARVPLRRPQARRSLVPVCLAGARPGGGRRAAGGPRIHPWRRWRSFPSTPPAPRLPGLITARRPTPSASSLGLPARRAGVGVVDDQHYHVAPAAVGEAHSRRGCARRQGCRS